MRPRPTASGYLLAAVLSRTSFPFKVARDQLAKVGLPAAVEAQEGDQDGLPDSVWAKIEAANGRGGAAGLGAMAQANQRSAQQAKAQLQEAHRKLAEEQRIEVERQRRQYAYNVCW